MAGFECRPRLLTVSLLCASALEQFQFGNGSRMYDAIVTASTALENLDARRILVLATDGDDNGSENSWRDALERASSAKVAIYIVSFENRYFDGVSQRRTREDSNLKALAVDTAGCYVRLGSTLERIRAELDGADASGSLC